jgi:myosin XV
MVRKFFDSSYLKISTKNKIFFFLAFTMPLSSDEYILDVTTELLKTNQPFYLIFCRSVWHFPLKRDPPPTPLYIEVLFNQVAPDYLEGLLLEMPNMGTPSPDYIRDIARIAAILHRAADLNHIPVMKEIKFLLPKPALGLREIKPAQWVNLVQAGEFKFHFYLIFFTRFFSL